MKKMRVCFVGVGSIARRHIRNLRTVCEKRNIDIVIDALRHSKSSGAVEGVDNVLFAAEELAYEYDAVFITNPTSMHLEAIKKMKDRTRAFFVEKPLCYVSQLNYELPSGLADCLTDNTGRVYYVACPLRYNPVISYLKNELDLSSAISVRCISSSYLPDWREGIDYRDTYSAHKSLGGGVSIDLIHEWDYIAYLFGFPQRVCSFIGKKSSLEIDSEDYAIYIAEYEKMIAELHLDYFGRKTIRKIEIFTGDDTIVGDLVENSVEYLVSGEKKQFSKNRDDYQSAELETFIDIVLGQIKNPNNLEHAISVLKLTKGEL